MLADSGFLLKTEFEQLLAGKSIYKTIDTALEINQLHHLETAIWTLLYMSGYLNAIDPVLEDCHYQSNLVIPNREIATLYKRLIQQFLTNGKSGSPDDNFLMDLLQGDIENFENRFHIFMEQVASVHDVTKKTQEIFYHALILGAAVCLPKNGYRVESNKESGYGRFDVAIIPHDKTQKVIIFEFKVGTNNDQTTLQTLAKEALEQIKHKHYLAMLEKEGFTMKQIIAVGVGFYHKAFALSYTWRT